MHRLDIDISDKGTDKKKGITDIHPDMFPTTEKSSDLPGDGRVGKGYYTVGKEEVR